jgi:four helix bundle protein
MGENRLENFGAYQKAKERFDLVVTDMGELRKDSRCYRLIAQQVASADSVCSNIEEGYGRLSRNEYVRFLDFARGSARETRGRYLRLRHWLATEIIQDRVNLADEIIAILTKTIQTLQNELRKPQGGSSYLRDEPVMQETYDEVPPLDTRHSTLSGPSEPSLGEPNPPA